MLLGALLLAVAAIFHPQRAAAAEITATQAELTAAYIYKIGLFVGWPTNKFPLTNEPVVIGVLGNKAISAELDIIARTNTLDGRKLSIRRLTPTADFNECHIVFVGRDQNVDQALDKLKTAKGILTFGDIENFAERGGMINLVLVGDTIRYKINRTAAEKAGIKLSAQLIRLALKEVKSEPEKSNR